MKQNYRSTILACYNGYITQAISINVAPLLYLTFRRSFSLSVFEISMLIAGNFLSQLLVDFLAFFFADRMNVRLFTVLSHVLTVMGLFGLSLFPMIFPPYLGLMLAEILLGVGGGFTEVMISPLLEACPTEGKSGNMSLLHSFYCWGQAGIILLSSAYFHFFEIGDFWIYLPWIWAIFPMVGAIAFCLVPIYELPKEECGGRKNCFSSPAFRGFLLMMFCGGAAEMTMSQWASSFAESALGISKDLGDLLGPCLFALAMGSARALYGRFSKQLSLDRLMLYGGVTVTAAYLTAAISPISWLSFVGCAVCGFAVGIFWPGILSQAAAELPTGGVAMFAVLALAGDVGCLLGPSLAGSVADLFGGDLRIALGFAAVFPLIGFFTLLLGKRRGRKE